MEKFPYENEKRKNPMALLIALFFTLFFGTCQPLPAAVAVVADCYCPSLGFEKVHEQGNVDEYHSWQYLQYQIKKQGDTLVLNNMSEAEIEALRDPSITAVIFNNPPWWCGRNLSQVLQSIPAQKILICWEPPTVLPAMYDPALWSLFDKVFIWDSSLEDKTHVVHFCYPSLRPLVQNLKPFSERHLLTQISRNKFFPGPYELYSLRKSINEYFDARPELDFTFYGQGWDPAMYRKCGGGVNDKIATLQNYKFSICFENTKNVKGYITEKIFDCFAAGCIPVYYGAPDIAEYIPKNCYIAWEDFGSIEKVYEHLQGIQEKEYLQYLENIRAFIASDAAKKFSNHAFASKVLSVLPSKKEGEEEKGVAARKT